MKRLYSELRLIVHNEVAIFTEKDAANPEMVRSRLLELFPDLDVQPRKHLKLAFDFIGDVASKQKCTTIRYSRNTVEYPAIKTLPIYQICQDSPDLPQYAGTVKVVGLCYKSFGRLDDADAVKDGFKSADLLKRKLCEIYGNIQDTELLTIYAITPSNEMLASPCD